MAKIFIEDEEIIVSYKETKESGEHIIEKDDYIMRSFLRTEFKASIFSYCEFEKILISKTKRFNEEYYKFVLFNDKESKAWNIIELSVKLDIKIKRMRDDIFVVIGDNKGADVTSQVSFCKLKPSLKVEEIAINFSRLNEILFLPKDNILLSYSDQDKIDDNIYHTLAVYNHDGILQKTVYEYSEKDREQYSYRVEGGKIKVTKHNK